MAINQSGYEEFPCDICGNTEAVEVPHARKYTNGQPIHICKRCGFVYVKLRRSAEEIANTWSNKIFGEGYTARIPAVKARQVYVAEFVDISIGLKGKRVCDIGAGEGQFLEIVREEYGAKAFGIEASEANCVKLAKQGIAHFNGTIEAYCENNKNNLYKADIVTIMWTLENCRSCRDMLAGAYGILVDNGYVVVATGSRILVPFKKPLNLYFGRFPADTHAFRFSANTLRGILAVCGFEVAYVNNYLDSDVLCIIARKVVPKKKNSFESDDYKKVYNFFERWHQETAFYAQDTANGKKK